MTLRGRQVDRALIKRIGRPVLWEKGILCPNRDSNDMHPATCPYCKDGRKGYQYIDPTNLKILVTSTNLSKDFDVAGAWEQGQCTGTIEAHQKIGDQDRFTFTDDPIIYDVTLERGGSSDDPLRVPAVVSLEIVRSIDMTYNEGTDYQLYQDPTTSLYYVRWLTASDPDQEAKYTVRMLAYPCWIVRGIPMVRSFSQGKKGQLLLKADLKRYDRVISWDTQN